MPSLPYKAGLPCQVQQLTLCAHPALQAVLQSPTPLKVVASSIDDCGPVTLDSFTSKDHLIDALKAGATVPHIAGPPRIINGKRLLDAAVYEPVPVESAMRDGCTHVMVLCTRPPPVGGPQGALDRIRKHAYGWMEKLAKGVLLGWDHGSGKTPGSAAVLSSSKPSIACPRTRLVHALLGCPHEAAQQHFEGVYVFPVYPATCHGCHPVRLSPDILRMAIQQGRAAMERALGPIMLQPEAATAQLLQQPAAGAAVELLAVAPASAAGVVEDLQSHSTATAMSAPGEHVLQPSVAAAALALYAAATGKAPQAVKQLVLRKHTVADTDRVHSRPAVHAKRSVTVHGGDDLYTIHDQPQQQQQASIFLPTPVYIEVQ